MQSGLVCIGLTTVDIVAHPVEQMPGGDSLALVDNIDLAPAGTAAAVALIGSTLGVKCRLVSAVGDDNAGKFIRASLSEYGVDVSLLRTLQGRRTSSTLLLVTKNDVRPKLHMLGASMEAEITDAATAAARAAKFVHWAGIGAPKLDGGAGAALLAFAKAAGATVTCDLISPRPTALDELKLLLPHVDYFLPSVDEAYGMSGCTEPDSAAAFFLKLGARAVIIKMGARGSYLALPNGQRELPAHNVNVVDTTSCGDSFCAGFIAALDRGWPPLEAAKFATATAALVAQGAATLGKVTSFEATERAMQTMPLRH
jgi:sugar/nucleoside kinase (ribokinase family)